MTRQYNFENSDHRLISECRNLIQTEADRAEVNFWVGQLNANEVETGSHVLRMQARQHLRIFKEKRGRKGK